MSKRDSLQKQPAHDASDVVEGPVGSAKLVDPSRSGPSGVDLGALATIKVWRADTAGEKRSTRAAESAQRRKS